MNREDQIGALRAHILARKIPDEITLEARHRFIVLSVSRVQAEGLAAEGVAISFRCLHSPRFDGDSHSSIWPTPDVEDWPTDNGAFQLAVQGLLADCAEPEVINALA